jgi:hydroxymethylpyrimidine pyrophosphatase-like HAD family hydrolase
MNKTNQIGLTIFDIDETLFHTKAKVQVSKEGKIFKILDNQQYNTYRLKTGESFNYGQFKSAKIFKETSTPIAKVIKRAKRIIHFATRKGSKVIIVTARQDMDDKKIFKEAFKAQGIDIGRVYVERAGNIGKETASENKVVIFKKYLDTGRYARIRLFDDDKKNLKAFMSLKKEYPGSDFMGYQVLKSGNIKKI